MAYLLSSQLARADARPASAPRIASAAAIRPSPRAAAITRITGSLSPPPPTEAMIRVVKLSWDSEACAHACAGRGTPMSSGAPRRNGHFWAGARSDGRAVKSDLDGVRGARGQDLLGRQAMGLENRENRGVIGVIRRSKFSSPCHGRAVQRGSHRPCGRGAYGGDTRAGECRMVRDARRIPGADWEDRGVGLRLVATVTCAAQNTLPRSPTDCDTDWPLTRQATNRQR